VSWLGAHGADARYLAPEQVRATDAAGAPADVYALALCLVEALILPSPAARGADRPRPLDAIESGHGIPPRLRKLLRACVDDDPRRRPAAGELGRELLESPEPPLAEGRGSWWRARGLLRRRRSRREPGA
jgi:hypothetical protein